MREKTKKAAKQKEWQKVKRLTKGWRVEVRGKEQEGFTDTWLLSSSSLWSRARAWPADVSCRPACAHSSAYTPALNPPPQTFL